MRIIINFKAIRTMLITAFLFLASFQAVFAEHLDKVVAIVNEEVITESELSKEVERLKQQMYASNTPLPADEVLRKQVLQHLINMNLQLQLAKQNNITIDDTDLNDALSKIANSNKLSMTQLREIIVRQGMTWDSYKSTIRKEMLISRVQQTAVAKDIHISQEQIEDYIKSTALKERENLTYRLRNIVVPFADSSKTSEVDRAFRKANEILKKAKQGQDFDNLYITESNQGFILEGGDLGERTLAELPELFAKKVVHMNEGEIAGPLKAGNGYQLIKLMKVSGEKEHHDVTKTHVRHILIKPEASMTASAADKHAENIYQQIKAGKSFALMAKQYSLDPLSANKGGDLGWLNPGELAPELEEAMEKLALNQVSKPIKSTFGLHIIEVLERKKVADLNSFKRQQALQALQRQKFAEAIQNWQQHLQSNAYVNVTDRKLA